MDEIFLCGTSGSSIDSDGLIGLLRMFVDLLIDTYRERDIPPRTIEAFEETFATGDVCLQMFLVFITLPSNPQAVSLAVRYSSNISKTKSFLEQLIRLNIRVILQMTAADQIVSQLPETNPKLGLLGFNNCISPESFVVACRRLWEN